MCMLNENEEVYMLCTDAGNKEEKRKSKIFSTGRLLAFHGTLSSVYTLYVHACKYN